MHRENLPRADLLDRARLRQRLTVVALALLLAGLVAAPIISLGFGLHAHGLRIQFRDEALPVSRAVRRLELDALELTREAGRFALTGESEFAERFNAQSERLETHRLALLAAAEGTRFEAEATELARRADSMRQSTEAAVQALDAGNQAIGELLLADSSQVPLEEFLDAASVLADDAGEDLDMLPERIGRVERLELFGQVVAAVVGVLGFLVALWLLRERRDLLNQTDEQRQRLMLLVESIGIGVYEVDRDGIIRYVNPAGATLLGYEAGELDGASAYELLHHRRPDGSPIAPEESWADAAAATQRRFSGEDHLVCKDGTFLPVEVTSSPERRGRRRRRQASGAVVVFQDISERLAQRELQEDFIGLASHELRSPLTSVQGFAQWLDRRAAAEPDAYDDRTRDAISTLRRGAERMGSTLRLFTQLASIEAGQFEPECEPVSLVPALRDEANALRLRYPAVDLVEEYTGDSVVIESDDDRIREIVTNLLDNAVRHGGEGVTIRLGVDDDGDSAHVRVRDNGPGIAPAIREHLFKRRRSTRGAGGTGLGLYISREIARRLGGDLTFESDEGGGAAFTLTLPRQAPPRPDADPSSGSLETVDA